MRELEFFLNILAYCHVRSHEWENFLVHEIHFSIATSCVLNTDRAMGEIASWATRASPPSRRSSGGTTFLALPIRRACNRSALTRIHTSSSSRTPSHPHTSAFVLAQVPSSCACVIVPPFASLRYILGAVTYLPIWATKTYRFHPVVAQHGLVLQCQVRALLFFHSLAR